MLRPAAAVLACACALPAGAGAAVGDGTGGASPDDPAFRPPGKARLVDGQGIPPADAPAEVIGAIEAANRISAKPYRYGGGHASFDDRAYDCSGAVSYVLNGAGLLASPLHSTLFMRWGQRGRGRWITVHANPGHAYIVVAGLRFDTGGRDRGVRRRRVRAGSGPRWASSRRPGGGYVARHPPGL